MLEKIFKLKQNKTTVKTELFAGVITFLTMSYIIIVNPSILGETGMDRSALFTATILTAIFGTLFMAFIANLPIAQASGMGLNAFFAFTVVLTMGYSWQFALTAVFIEGIIFLILTFFNIRELIIKSIPRTLRNAIPVGIGLFITLIGLQSASIVVSDPNTMVALGDWSNHNVWIGFFGLAVTAVLFARNIKGAILFGIVAATVFAYLLGDVSLPNKIVSLPPSIRPIFLKFEWAHILSFDMFIVVLTFLFVNLFDTVGTLIGVVSKTGIADENGDFPQMKKALFADALGTTVGAVFGTSTVTSYVESASGVVSGGRTGLTSVGTSLMFVLALFFAPLFLMVPAAATAPALVVVGLFMISAIVKIDFNDFSEAFPAFLTIIFMPFAFSIAQGIVFGMLGYVVIKSLSGKTKDISVTLWIMAAIFVIKIILENGGDQILKSIFR